VICPTCRGGGYRTVTISVPYDGAILPDYIDVNCECNPDPTDEDWEPRGTAWEDFNPPFNDRQYAGL
jgi:hypothetical protein